MSQAKLEASKIKVEIPSSIWLKSGNVKTYSKLAASSQQPAASLKVVLDNKHLLPTFAVQNFKL
jgi:hypothetical protein